MLSATLVGYDGVNGGPVSLPPSSGGHYGDTIQPGPSVVVGQNLVFTFVVANQGTVNLSNAIVTDSQPGLTLTQVSNGDGDNILKPGETWIYTASSVAAGSGAQTNTGNVTAKTLPLPGTMVTDTDLAYWTVNGVKFFVVDNNADKTFRYASNGASIGNSALVVGNSEPRDIGANATGTKLWVLDKNKKVNLYNADGTSVAVWTTSGLGSEPEGLTLDTKFGNDLWMATRDRKIYWYDESA